jgi:hypothetical protein
MDTITTNKEIIVLAIVLFILFVAVLILFLRKRKKVHIAETLEEKILGQLQRSYRRLGLGSISRRKTLRYYKRLKIVMTVYMKEKYNVTIRDRITQETFTMLLKEYPKDSIALNMLTELFDKMENVKHNRKLESEIDDLYKRIIAFFQRYPFSS